MVPCSDILSQLLLNNCPPGPLENGPLRAEVDRLKRKICALRTKLQEYEELLQKHETILSIARKVPLDVLGVIFSFVLPDCSTQENWQELTSLGLVCKDWHQATRFAHRFSSHLQLKDIKLDYEKVMSWSHRATEGRSLQIEGAGWYCPLHRDPDGEAADSDSESCNRDDGATDSDSESCDQDDEATNSECRFASPVLLRLMEEGPVLDHLFFKGVRSRCYRHLLDLLASYNAGSSPRPWDNLKNFTLHFRSEHNYPSVPLIGPEPIDVPPCITSLNLGLPDADEVEIGANSPPLLIQPGIFEHLTSFSLKWKWSHHDGKILLAALAHCTNLEIFALKFQSSEWRCTDSSAKVVKLPKLREFKLTKPQGDSLKILNFIDTPALTHLDVHIRGEVKPDTLKSFITKQTKRSQDTLHVSLRISHRQGWDIPEFLQHVPYVTHLKLDWCIGAPKDRKNEADFFQSLDFYGNLLPHLKVLEVFGLPSELPLTSIEQYIAFRRYERADDGLKALVVKYGGVWLPDSCEIGTAHLVEKLREEGLSVDIEYPKFLRTNLLDVYS